MSALASSPRPLSALRPVQRELLLRPAHEAARLLLGTYIVGAEPDGLTVGRIVEAEAYAGAEDRASHARAGRTRRTAPMFDRPGTAYVYLVYGLHDCLNVVAHEEGAAGAVLLRALEPVAGVELMRRRRGSHAGADARLAAGPARLCQALAVDRSFSGADLLEGSRLWLAQAVDEDRPADDEIASGPRIGVGYAGDDWAGLEWRFWLGGHPSVSRR
jgi:DNA-3-methyladenine glycosylase